MAGSKAATRWRTCPSSGHRLRFRTDGVHGGSDRTAPTTPQKLLNADRKKTWLRQRRDPNSWPAPGVEWTMTVRKRARGDSLDLGSSCSSVRNIGGLSLSSTSRHCRPISSCRHLRSLTSCAPVDRHTTGLLRQVANSVSNQGYGAEINPREANTEITVYPTTLVLIDGNSPEISANAPLCNLASSSSVISVRLPFRTSVEPPGVATIYFIDSDAHAPVAKILVTVSTPPSSLPGWAVLVVGALATACGAVLMIWWKRGGLIDDLRRADKGRRTAVSGPLRG